MKRKNTYKENDMDTQKAEEPSVVYGYHKDIDDTRQFTFNNFKKVASKTDFTQKEWAEILHVSERTLQRYSKQNATFSFSISDRILQIDKVFKRGQEVFGSYAKFNQWLRNKPTMLEGSLSLHSLASFDGINNLLTQIGRIEHGILA